MHAATADGWQTISYKQTKYSKKKKSSHKDLIGKHSNSSISSEGEKLYNPKLYSAAGRESKLEFLKSSLDIAWQLSFQSKELHKEILSTLAFYHQKIETVITKDIWQAPTPIFKSDFPTPKPVYNRDRFLVSAAAEETIIQPTPIYSSQLPSYLFEGDIFQSGTRLLRTRSTSWSTPIRPPGFESSPKRLLSPPFEKKTTDLGEIILKQEKAKEFREMLVAAKLKKQNEKRISRKEVELEEQRIQLKESIAEKLSKAEKIRTEHLKVIQSKHKVEETKRDEVHQLTQLLLQTKKSEAEAKVLENEQRRLEIEDEKVRKTETTGVSALSRAATKRRLEIAASKSEKLARKEADQLQRAVELDQLKRTKVLRALERQKEAHERILEIRVRKVEVEEEKKRNLREKLEMNAARKLEKVMEKVGKMAAANLNAKTVADRKSTRKAGDGGAGIDGLLTPTFETMVLDEAAKKRLKKSKMKMESLTKNYVFVIAVDDVGEEKIGVLRQIAGLNKHLDSLDYSNYAHLQTYCHNFVSFLATEGEFVYNQVCVDGLLLRLVESACAVRVEHANEVAVCVPLLEVIEMILKNETALSFFCQAPALLPLKILDLLSKLVPFCSSARPTSFEVLACMSLLRIATRCVEYGSGALEAGNQTFGVTQQLIYYSFSNGVFEHLKTLFSLVHGIPESLDGFVMFIVIVTELVDAIVSFGNEKLFTSQPKKISQQTQTVLNFCLSTNLVGLITLLDSVLLSVGGSYRTAVQEDISSGWIEESLLVFKLLNKIFQIQVLQVQGWLTNQDQISELFHLMLFWIHLFSTQRYPIALHPLIDEIVCNKNPHHTSMVNIGLPGLSLLQRLCHLPFTYFNTVHGRSILFPTLITLAVDKNNRKIIEDDVSMDFFDLFMNRSSGRNL